MIEIPLPDAQDHPAGETVRSFAACLASATHTPIEHLPLPDADLAGSVALWRSWLGGRGAGLVPIARPATFTWPGYWIAVLRGDDGRAERPGSPGSAGSAGSADSPDSPDSTASTASTGSAGATGSQSPTHPTRPTGSAAGEVVVLMFGTPSGVVLSPQDASLLGRAAVDLPISEGYVIGALDPRLDRLPARPGAPTLRGRVEVLALAGEKAGPMRTVPAARALAGRGLEGDRYAAKAGTFTPADPRLRGYDLTLVEAEVLDDLELPGGGRLGYPDARRNVVTRGIDLNSLVGRRFRVGSVECLGQRMAEPCAHLEKLTVSGVLRPLIHRAGLRADVLTDGEIRAGDVVETID